MNILRDIKVYKLQVTIDFAVRAENTIVWPF